MAKKKQSLATEEMLEQALVSESEQPYKVPNNWVWTRFESINKYTGRSVNPMYQPNSFFELYSVPSSEFDYPEILNGTEIGSTKQAVAKNDVLLCKINPRINRVWIVSKHTNYELIASSEWIVFRNHDLCSQYIKWYFKTKYFREYMLSNVSGVGGSLMRAQPKFVNGYPIPIPPFAEQQRIVDRIESLFDKLDQAKGLIQDALDSFENRKAAILHRAFSGELTKKWREENKISENSLLSDILKYYSDRKVNKDIKNILENQESVLKINNIENSLWYKCSIGAVGVVSNGSTPSRQNLDFWDGGIPWVSSGEVRNNIVQITKETISQSGYDNSSVKMLPVGTVLIAMIGEGKTRGQSAVLNINATINQNIAAIDVSHKKVESKFLWYWLQKQYQNNREKGSGTGPQALNCQRVRELNFVLPPLSEQQEIVRILDRLLEKEQNARELYESIESIDLMKKSILARAFRGELGTNDPEEESAMELLKAVLSENAGNLL